MSEVSQTKFELYNHHTESNIFAPYPYRFIDRKSRITRKNSVYKINSTFPLDFQWLKKYYSRPSNRNELTFIPESITTLEELQVRTKSTFFLREMEEILLKYGEECVFVAGDRDNDNDFYLKIYPSEELKKEFGF